MNEQVSEIQRLLNRIEIKAYNFNSKHPKAGDLSWVVSELREIDEFLNDEYLSGPHKMDSQANPI